MKKTFKDYFKLGVLLLGISLALVNCQKDDNTDLIEEVSSAKARFSISKVGASEIIKNQQLVGKLEKIELEKKKKKQISSSNKEVYSSEYDFTIITDYASYIESLDGTYHSYTFPILRGFETVYTENILFSLQEDGTYETSIVTYNVTSDEKELLTQRIPVNLEGKVSFTGIDSDNLLIDIFSKVGCTYTIEEYCNCNVHPDENGFSSCHSSCYEIIISETCPVDTSGGAGPGPTDPTDPTDPTNTDTTTPSGSGFTPPTSTFTPCENCPEFIDEEEECASALQLSNIATIPGMTVEIMNCLALEENCNNAFLLANYKAGSTYHAGFALAAAEAFCADDDVDFVEQIIITIPDPCQKKIVKEALNIAHPLVQNIKNLFNSDDKYKLIIISESLDATPGINPLAFNPAKTSPLPDCDTDGNCIITIKLDSDMLAQSTDYFITANVLHEMVHAALVYFYSTGELQMTGTFDPFTAMLFDAMAEHEALESGLVYSDGSNLNDIHHLYMTNSANNLQNALQEYIESIDPALPISDYKDLTWGGSLSTTSSYTEIYDTDEKVKKCKATNVAEILATDIPYTYENSAGDILSGTAEVKGTEANLYTNCDE